MYMCMYMYIICKCIEAGLPMTKLRREQVGEYACSVYQNYLVDILYDKEQKKREY